MMTKLPLMALLCAGSISRSPLARLPQIRRYVRWVKASSYRVAARVTTALRAGVPVQDISELQHVKFWLVYAPAEDLSPIIRELGTLGESLEGSQVIILDEALAATGTENLRQLGAQVATFSPVEAEEKRYVMEGDPDALKTIRQLVDSPNSSKVVELKKGAKPEYIQGALAATKSILPCVADAVERFTNAGISAPEAKSITEALVTESMRAYFRAGRRAIKS